MDSIPIRSPLRGTVLLIAVAAVALAPPLATAAAVGDAGFTRVGLGYPGSYTTFTATALQSVALLASWLTVGGLCAVMFILPTRRTRPQAVHDGPELAIARRAAIVWAVAAAAMVPFSAADAGGKELSALGEHSNVSFLLTSTDFPVAWMIATAAAGLAALLLRRAFLWRHLIGPLALAVPAILAPVVVGDILVGPGHDHGGDAGAIQAVVEAVCFGAATVLALRAVGGSAPPVPAVRRFALVSAAALPLLALSAAILLWFRMAGLAPLSNPTGRWSLLAIGSLAVVIAATLVLARRPGDRAGGLFAVIALAGAVTAAAHGAMGRIPPPQYFVPTELVEVFLGYTLPDAPDLGTLLDGLAAQPAVRRHRGGGDPGLRRRVDPPRQVRRALAGRPDHRLCVGWVLVVVVTSSGLGKYSGADFAVHMAVHMTLSMLVPLPLVLGGPITLALRALPSATKDEQSGPHEWIVAVLHSRPLQALCHPLLVFGIYIGSYYALYLTDAFGTLMKFHWAHQLMNAHFLLVGCLYFGLIIGVDPTPRRLPSLAKLGFVLAAMPFHAFFGVILMSGGTIVGESFYQHLEVPWRPDLADTQQTAGGIAWAGGEIPLVIVVVVLALQWAIQDGKEARRIDRHLDSGLDDSHDAYNAMLERMARRTRAPEDPS